MHKARKVNMDIEDKIDSKIETILRDFDSQNNVMVATVIKGLREAMKEPLSLIETERKDAVGEFYQKVDDLLEIEGDDRLRDFVFEIYETTVLSQQSKEVKLNCIHGIGGNVCTDCWNKGVRNK